MTNGKVYALTHPITDDVRYIGQTWRSLAVRLRQHLNEARRGSYHCHRWIRTLPESPKIVLLADGFTDQAALDEAECDHISRYTNLTNMEQGGRGGVPNDETRQLHRERAVRVMNEPHQRARMSRETRERMKKPEEKDRVRRENKERWAALSEEERAARVRKASEARWKKHHHERSAV